MKIYHPHTTGVEQVHFRSYDFDQLINQKDNCLFIDAPQEFNKIDKSILETNNIIYFEMEEPNRFFSDTGWFNHFAYDQYFSNVLSICPYTVEWLSKYTQCHVKRKSVLMPIKWQPIVSESKKYDIIYAGHIYPGHIEKIINEIKSFNYCVVSNTIHDMATLKCINNYEKYQAIAQSKITLVHNLLFPTQEHIANIKKLPHWEKNEAFSHLDKEMVPQIKIRALEAAMCRSLIVCQKDPWNIIEKYFDPGKEFIYYQKDKLKETVDEILNNYGNYLPIIENAYQKVQNYTTEKFYDKYLKELE